MSVVISARQIKLNWFSVSSKSITVQQRIKRSQKMNESILQKNNLWTFMKFKKCLQILIFFRRGFKLTKWFKYSRTSTSGITLTRKMSYSPRCYYLFCLLFAELFYFCTVYRYIVYLFLKLCIFYQVSHVGQPPVSHG